MSKTFQARWVYPSRWMYPWLILFLVPSIGFSDETQGNPPHQAQRFSVTDGGYENAWTISIPTGSADFLSSRYRGIGGVIEGLHASVVDYGAAVTSFPTVGIYRSNLGLDPNGTTPDLANPITGGGPGAFSPGSPLFSTELFPLSPAPAEPDMHAVIQLPPGDQGFLGIGADSDTNVLGGDEIGGISNPFGSSSVTADGFTTPGLVLGSADLGIGPAIECGSDFTPRLALTTIGPAGEPSGDYETLTTSECAPLGISFWGDVVAGTPASWKLFLSFVGVPLIPIGAILPSIDCGNGHSYLRVGAEWPRGAGGLTFNFVAVAGVPGVIGSVAVSNEVTLASLPDFGGTFGVKDDGTYESGWVASIPSGSSDFYSLPWGDAGFCPFPLSQSSYAVMDFGSSATAYPRSGQAPPNFVVDPSGNSPDLSNPYVDSPLLFAPLTFVTTAGQMVQNSYPPYSPATDVIEFLQFPPGDPGLLGIGADTNGAFVSGVSGWSIDGYSTPANLFGNGNWGMRTQ